MKDEERDGKKDNEKKEMKRKTRTRKMRDVEQKKDTEKERYGCDYIILSLIFLVSRNLNLFSNK